MNYHFDEIFKILKKEVKNYNVPVVTLYSQNKHVFHVLISCLLSLRTRDEITAKVTRELFKNVNKPEDILRIGLPRLRKKIKSINFYKTKAKNIYNVCKILKEKYNSQVPKTEEELLGLPGVGRKTMNIVMAYGHYKDGFIPIDVHCHRIPNRLGWFKTKTPEETEIKLKEILPKKYWWDFNNIFVAFGQSVCNPVSPKCSICPIFKYCERIGVKRNR
ncbi:MAG: endonuclease III [Nanoarchaeota archaeon]